MKSERISVREGATGILTLSSKEGTNTFLPNYDMDQALEWLLLFQELSDRSGTLLKDSYRVEGHNWYPPMVSHLYWYVFFPWVKYFPLIEDFIQGKKEYVFENHGMFSQLIALIKAGCGNSSRPSWRVRVHDWLWRFHNAWLVRWKEFDLVFFRFAFHDFRSKEIIKILKASGLRVLEAVPAQTPRMTLKSFFQSTNYYFYSQPVQRSLRNAFSLQFILPENKMLSHLFSSAIQYVETTITGSIEECKIHKRNFSTSNIKFFYGFDDINDYLFPLLFAAKDLAIPTVGHQHGAYVKRHAGYMMRGIAPSCFEWYERVIVWGDYWKKKMLRDAPIHPSGRWVVGSTKITLPYSSQESQIAETDHRVPTTIFIPYEFLADTASIGKYIEAFLSMGYVIYFRPRPDESLDAQIEAYQLSPQSAAALKISTGPLDREFLDKIDIVAGTMTTLIYELLPAGKIIWYLDTPYRHLLDLVEEGLAHCITLEEILPPGKMPSEKLRPTKLAPTALFGEKPLELSIQQEVMECMHQAKN